MTGRHRSTRPTRPGVWAAAAIAVVAAVSLSALVLGRDSAGVAGTPAAIPEPTWAPAPVFDPAAVARPVRLRIPAIGVDSAVVDVGVDGAGALIPPSDPDVTGWFTSGPAPGAIGPALLAGHVDSRTGPAVFYRLSDLHPGDEVLVERADATTAVFVVRATVQVAKTAFPTELVYSPLPIPVLRLVTCGGTLDAAARSYRDNLIVEAVPK